MHNRFKTQKIKHLMLAMGPRDLNSAPYSPVHCSSHSMTSFQSSELTELPVVENSQLFARRAHSARYALLQRHVPCRQDAFHSTGCNLHPATMAMLMCNLEDDESGVIPLHVASIGSARWIRDVRFRCDTPSASSGRCHGMRCERLGHRATEAFQSVPGSASHGGGRTHHPDA